MIAGGEGKSIPVVKDTAAGFRLIRAARVLGTTSQTWFVAPPGAFFERQRAMMGISQEWCDGFLPQAIETQYRYTSDLIGDRGVA